MPNFNSLKTALYTSILALLIMLYSIKFDIVDLHIPATPLLIGLKSFFAFFPVIFFYYFKKINLDKKIFYCSLIWATYCILSTYYLAINYWVSSIQLIIVYTGVLFIDRIQFFIMYSYLLVGTCIAILYSSSPYGFGALGAKHRAILFDDYLSTQFLTGMVYFLVTYPRIKKLKDDLKFSNFGKASSFILHEMQKPLSRMQSDGAMQIEIDSLKRTLNIAQQLHSGSLNTVKFNSVNIEKLCLSTVEKYNEFLEYFQIKVACELQVKNQHSDEVMLGFILDNLIRNAIEANKDNQIDKRWIKIISNNNYLCITNPFTNMIDESDLFTPLKSSKEGNMGTGLHFCKTIADGLNHSVKARCNDNIFEIRIDF